MENSTNPVIKTSEWVFTLLITAIPLVGLIMLFVWAFGGNTNPNKANWAKALLIWYAIFLVLYIIIFMIFGAALFSASEFGS